MKKNYKQTPLVDEYLQSLQGMQPAETSPFFYTRLKATMEKQVAGNSAAAIRYRVLAMGMLVVFLAANCFMLSHRQQQPASRQNVATAQQSFVNTYGVGNAPSY